MSDTDEKPGIKITDRRRFTIDANGNVAESDKEEEATDAKKETKPQPEPEEKALADEPEEEQPETRKGPSLRDRVKAKLSGKKPPDADRERFDDPLPAIDFTAFVMSLGSSVLIHFGDVEDPMTGEKHPNLAAAKQTIDILGMLQEKTKGNLTEPEDKILEGFLYDLRLRYVALTKK